MPLGFVPRPLGWWWLVAVTFALGAGCASTHTVRPLGRGNAVVHASLGGPLVNVSGAVIPTPILTLGGALGVRADSEVTLHADATAALFGVAHVEPGVAFHPVIRDGGLMPTLTTTLSLHLLTDFSATRIAPQATLAGAWRIQRRHLIYAGADLAVASGSAARLVLGPLLGAEARLGRRVGVSLEAKWLAPYYDVAPLAPSWISPGNHGYFSVLLGVNTYLGDVR